MSVGHLALWTIGWSDRKPNFGPILDTYGIGLVKLWPPNPRRPHTGRRGQRSHSKA
jgi:hypothetical protein